MRIATVIVFVLLLLTGYSSLTNSTPPAEPVAIPTVIIESPLLTTVTEEPNNEVPAEEARLAVVPQEPVTPIATSVAMPATEPEAAPKPAPRYDTPALDFDTLNTQTQPAVVNILCIPQQGSPISGATGSGVVIDPRGVILTNAHVAQYVALSYDPRARISCVVRIGAPAAPRYTMDVLALPLAWVHKNASGLKAESPTGSGEDDWALLYISGRTDGSPRPTTYPYMPFDPRQAIALADDPVLIVGYPAGFLGGATLTRDLWPSSAVVSIKNVYTFVSNTIDIISLGGSVVAQGGASGGAVVNQWGKLVGVVVTSSVADTTAERDLRALTLSHINNSVTTHLGISLLDVLIEDNFEARVDAFKQDVLPALLDEYGL